MGGVVNLIIFFGTSQLTLYSHFLEVTITHIGNRGRK
jgi:hypothetical protein